MKKSPSLLESRLALQADRYNHNYDIVRSRLSHSRRRVSRVRVQRCVSRRAGNAALPLAYTTRVCRSAAIS